MALTTVIIQDCKKAIEIDPNFGNPYNDIGVYLMQIGLLDDAIPWFEKAKGAARYIPRHFPFLNLGHIYVAKESLQTALLGLASSLRERSTTEESSSP